MHETVIDRIRRRLDPVLAVVTRYADDQGGRLAASLAYRAVFALAPLLLVAVAVAGFIYGTADAQARLLSEIDPLVGPEVTRVVSDLLAQAASSRNVTGIIGIALMSWTASVLFLEAQRALDLIFGEKGKGKAGVVAWMVRRLLALAAALGMGIVLLGVMISSALWRSLQSLVDWSYPQAFSWVGQVVGLLLLVGLFTIVFRYVPSRPIPWRAAVVGGAVTGCGFSLAGVLIGRYFDPARFSGTGFAGGLVLILFSVYVLAQVVLFGAEVIDVHLLPETGGGVQNPPGPTAPVGASPEGQPSGVAWFAAGLATGAYLITRYRNK